MTVAAAWLLLAGACAKSTEQRGTGETHFLWACTDRCGSELSCLDAICTRACDDDDACTGLVADATCETLPAGSGDADAEGVCDVVCERDQDCNALGADYACEDGRCRNESSADEGAQDAAAPTPSCPAGCVAVNGYGEDSVRRCVDRERLEFVGCDCNPAASVPRCGRRSSDDTLWLFHAGELGAESGIAECTPAEFDRVSYSCEFATCEVPPASVCTLEATCADRGCDNLQFDAQGCQRPACTTDAQCNVDERCVQLTCVTASWCTPMNPGPDEACGCGGPAACFRGGACNPVATVGPGGEWQSLQFVEMNLICSGSCTNDCALCSSTTTVDRFGVLAIRPMGATESRRAMLSQEDLNALVQIVDGPTLRAGLRDGFGCGQNFNDSGTVLRLELPDATLEQEITCAMQGTEVRQLADMLYAY